MNEIIDENARETVVEVPTPHNKKGKAEQKSGVYVKINENEWKIGETIKEEDGRVVIGCKESFNSSTYSIIKVVRRDIFEQWQKMAQETK